jgi:hypothetical protein
VIHPDLRILSAMRMEVNVGASQMSLDADVISAPLALMGLDQLDV